MSAPGLDRLLSSGYYGTAINQFVAISTDGWYDIFEDYVPLAVSATLSQVNSRVGTLSIVNSRVGTLSETGTRKATLTKK